MFETEVTANQHNEDLFIVWITPSYPWMHINEIKHILKKWLHAHIFYHCLGIFEVTYKLMALLVWIFIYKNAWRTPLKFFWVVIDLSDENSKICGKTFIDILCWQFGKEQAAELLGGAVGTAAVTAREGRADMICDYGK